MQIICKFINCYYYDFVGDDGNRYTGYKVNCFDPESGQLLKVSHNQSLDLNFGDDIVLEATPNGRYIRYSVA